MSGLIDGKHSVADSFAKTNRKPVHPKQNRQGHRAGLVLAWGSEPGWWVGVGGLIILSCCHFLIILLIYYSIVILLYLLHCIIIVFGVIVLVVSDQASMSRSFH